MAGGVHALLSGFAHFFNATTESGLNGIEEARFANAGGTDKNGNLIMKRAPKLVNPIPLFGTDIEDGVAYFFINAEGLLGFSRCGEVDFVDTNNGRNFIHLGHNQKAVEFAEAGAGLADGENDNNLVRVCDPDLFLVGEDVALFRGWPCSGKHPFSFGHRFDGAGPIIVNRNSNPVAGSDEVSILPLFFKPPRNLGYDLLFTGIDPKEAALGLEN